ncbi:hypothetical protein Tco_1078445 [Tanacetum coccineum]|uniref:Uncharacterized protein n=1 Tax=Tanacetum coccineum TaxID=301880 RepID=A0ABQ5HP16_9ASTR
MDAFFEDIFANNVPTPPTQTTGPQPAQTTGPNNEFEELLSRWRSMLRIETGNRSLRKAFRENNEQPLKIGFDYEDLGTFHPLGNFSGMLNSLMGETVWPLPLACEWDEIPEAFKAHIYPTLERYFNLAEWYKNKNRIKADHYAKHTSPDEAKNHPLPPRV